MSSTKNDITGISEIAKSIPDKAWNIMVDTACSTFEKILAPLTESTEGLGRLIKAKFDRLIDGEKLLVAETFSKANEKVVNSGSNYGQNPNLNIIIRVIEESSRQTDQKIRDLWSNLLANEIIDGSIHPEVINILSRMSSTDAKYLAEIGDGDEGIKRSTMKTFAETFIGTSLFIRERSIETFSEKHLESLNLIHREHITWKLTAIGIGFIEAVSEPRLKTK